MKSNRNKRGFTLIELLVVVLIIGILAAVAIPQYQLVVEKTRASEAFVALESWERAANLYYMTNGTYKGMNSNNVDIIFSQNMLRDFTLVAGDARTTEDGNTTSVSLQRNLPSAYWIVFGLTNGGRSYVFCKTRSDKYLAVCRSLGAKNCITINKECWL